MAKPNPAAFHHKLLNAAMKKGDHGAAKTHAFNLGNSLHKSMGAAMGSESEPDMRDSQEAAEPGEGGNWMAGAVRHPGALHQSLGVPMGQKIPPKKIAKAATSSNPLLAKRAKLAETFAKFRGH